MSMNLEITPEKDHLRVSVNGQFSLMDANGAFVEILEAVAQHKSKKTLVDCTGLNGLPSTTDRFIHSEFAAKALRKCSLAGVRFGYIAIHPVLDDQKFGETVAVNRGVNVRTYDNIEDTLRWLDINPAEKAIESDNK